MDRKIVSLNRSICAQMIRDNLCTMIYDNPHAAAVQLKTRWKKISKKVIYRAIISLPERFESIIALQ